MIKKLYILQQFVVLFYIDNSSFNSCNSCTSLLQVDGNLRTEPKHIVFLSQLLLLFQFCHSCKADNPLVETKAIGSNGVVTTKCNNPKCTQKIRIWHSQPLMPGRKKARAGNFMMCMATLLGGGSFTKVRQIFLHMGPWMCLAYYILPLSESKYRSCNKNKLLLFLR